MRQEAVYAAAIPLFALGSIYIIYAVWDQLSRAEIVSIASLSWLPTVAVVWGCVCTERLTHMKRTAFRLITGLVLLLPVASTVAAENPLSTYTRTLIDLMNVFGKLNQAVADRMKEDERYVLARLMSRLSTGFYALMNAKGDFAKALEDSAAPGASIDYGTYVPAVQKLQQAVACLSAQFKDKGARIGALSEIDGTSVESNLRKGLEEKADDLKKVVQDLGMNPSGSDRLVLKATIMADGEKAREAAERLYKMTAEFAHVLDPTVIAPDRPPPCIKSPQLVDNPPTLPAPVNPPTLPTPVRTITIFGPQQGTDSFSERNQDVAYVGGYVRLIAAFV
jgi:hypothetical protein